MEDKRTILIVDDERDLVETIQYNLEQEGYACDVAYDGEQALEEVKRKRPDLILLDLSLPKLDGVEVCRRLKEDDAYKDIPVLIFTIKTQSDAMSQCARAGADEYIIKPYGISTVIEAVKEYV